MLVVEIILRTGSGVGSDFRLDSFHDGRDGSNVRLELPRDPHELLQVGAKTGQLGQLKERNSCWQWLWHSWQNGCFQNQRTQVCIQPSEINTLNICLLLSVAKSKIKKGRLEMAPLKRNSY